MNDLKDLNMVSCTKFIIKSLDLFIIINIHQKWIKGLSVFYRVRCIILDTKILVDLFLNTILIFLLTKSLLIYILNFKRKKLIIFK